MTYRCEARSLEAFIQQLAVSYVARGYWFYVTGWVPERKAPHAVDEKLIAKYGLAVSKAERARRKRLGRAAVHYLRHERFFVLIATKGEHVFREEEAACIRDIRRVPLVYGGYKVSHRNGHASVRIEQEEYKRLKSYFLDLAVRRRGEALEELFRGLRWEPYGPIRRQLLNVRGAVNRERKLAGYEPISVECIRTRRRSIEVFVEDDACAA